MANEKFEIGDVVVLKSGGPNMTVSDVNDTHVTCQWFVGTTLNSENFTPEVLRKAGNSDFGALGIYKG